MVRKDFSETLFRDIDVFNPEYSPKDFRHRDGQMKALASCLRPTLGKMKGRPVNALISGPPATGKTTAVRNIFEQLKEGSDAVLSVHINSFVYSSAYQVLSEIHRQVLGFKAPPSGIPAAELVEKIAKGLLKSKQTLLVTLDDAEGLFRSAEANEALYLILRMHESFPGIRSGVWIVLPDSSRLAGLEDRVRSVFNPSEVKFPLYSFPEALSILKERADLGLVPGALGEEALEKIAEIATEMRDLRLGIELMKQAALLAESDNRDEITSAHIARAASHITKDGAAESTGSEKPSDSEISILNILKGGPKESGELFASLRKPLPDINYTKFFRTLKSLEESGKVSTEYAKGKKGRTRIIRLQG